MILIDNYDSFTYNIVQYLKELGINPKVFKNDKITVEELEKTDFSSIIISPGPGNPNNAGISLDIINKFHKTKKILGICLGHQCIAQYFGCKIIKDKEPMHGKVSQIYFVQDDLFEGIEQGFEATRYHSLIVDNNSLSKSIKPLAYTKDKKPKKHEVKQFDELALLPSCPLALKSNILMALKHKDYPIYGVQFHPEAILTRGGKRLLLNFINI